VKAVIVSSEYLDSLEETIYSLKHSYKDIKRAEKEVAKGNYVTFDQLQEDLANRIKKNAS
jgi:hypothetical protein